MTTNLTTAQADALQEYIWTVRNALRLSHWDVFLAAEPATEGANAHVQPVEGRYVASVHIAEDWLDRTPEERRNDIVHELLHLVHREQTDVIRCGLLRSGYLSEAAQNLVWESFYVATERMVDHLASAIDHTFPLPQIPEEGTQ